VLALALTPALLTRGVLEAADGAALIALPGLELVGPSRGSRTGTAAVQLPAIAVAAQHHLVAAASTQEQAGWDIGQARSSGYPPRRT